MKGPSLQQIQTKYADAVTGITRLPDDDQIRMQDQSYMESDPKGGVTSPVKSSRTVTVRENRLDSRDIFADTREVIIKHGQEIYRLRLTAQNKLILTK